jgi:hypothetical protein
MGRPLKKKPALFPIDSMAMHRIRDTAHKVWLETRCPNGNLVMLEALRLILIQEGYPVSFEVPNLETKD